MNRGRDTAAGPADADAGNPARPSFDWEAHGFRRRADTELPTRNLFFEREHDGRQFLVMSGDFMIAGVDDERHAVSEAEALAWFSIWLPELIAFAPAELRERFQRYVSSQGEPQRPLQSSTAEGSE